MVSAAFIVAWLSVGATALPAQALAQTTCEVTIPAPGGNGSEQLTAFGLWPNGEVVFKPGGAGFVTKDGAL